MANVWPNSSGFTTEDTEHIEELIVASQMGGVSWRVKLGWSGEFFCWFILGHCGPLVPHSYWIMRPSSGTRGLYFSTA